MRIGSTESWDSIRREDWELLACYAVRERMRAAVRRALDRLRSPAERTLPALDSIASGGLVSQREAKLIRDVVGSRLQHLNGALGWDVTVEADAAIVRGGGCAPSYTHPKNRQGILQLGRRTAWPAVQSPPSLLTRGVNGAQPLTLMMQMQSSASCWITHLSAKIVLGPNAAPIQSLKPSFATQFGMWYAEGAQKSLTGQFSAALRRCGS
jgi:hypothetical protein